MLKAIILTATKRVAFSLDYWSKHKSQHIFLIDIIRLYPFLSRKVHSCSLKYFFSLRWKLRLLFSRLLFRKSHDSFSFLVIHFLAFCWNKTFFVSFLSVSRLNFLFTGFLSLKYPLTTSCQRNKWKTGGKNNWWVTIEWKLLCLSCDAKDCKHYTFAFKIHKSLVEESRRLYTKCDWPQWTEVKLFASH